MGETFLNSDNIMLKDHQNDHTSSKKQLLENLSHYKEDLPFLDSSDKKRTIFTKLNFFGIFVPFPYKKKNNILLDVYLHAKKHIHLLIHF